MYFQRTVQPLQGRSAWLRASMAGSWGDAEPRSVQRHDGFWLGEYMCHCVSWRDGFQESHLSRPSWLDVLDRATLLSADWLSD
jgi:hypothetical protein